MRDTYSLTDAKAKLSAIIRHVRKGHPVIVTVHGEPVVQILAVSAGIDSRLAQMAERGVLVRSGRPLRKFPVVARRSGALKRFMEDRGD